MYEMYVVKVMQEQKTSDETSPGIKCEIQIRKQGKYNYKFAKLLDEKFDALNNGDKVIVLTTSEHEDLLQQLKNADNTNQNEDELEKERQSVTFNELDGIITGLKGEKTDLKTFEKSNDSKIEDLQKQILEQEQTIADLKQMNDNIAKEKDAIAKQLENSADASEIEDLQNKITTLNNKLELTQSNYENLLESSDELTFRNEDLIKQNNDLKNKFDEVTNTNKLLNESLIATNTNFKETKQQMQSDFENKEKELKETIKKQQSHIDEITQIKDSLLPFKDNIPQKQHFSEIDALKDELRNAKQEIGKINADIETKLATQKSDLLIEHTNEKAQLLVAYNQDLNKMKLQYNNLVKDYNHLLNGVESLTRINTLFNGKHNEIKENKEQIPLLEIISEQLPPSDEHVLEFVPKD